MTHELESLVEKLLSEISLLRIEVTTVHEELRKKIDELEKRNEKGSTVYNNTYNYNK